MGRTKSSITWCRARGGADDGSNLSVVCRAHNRLAAEQQFGRQHMDRAAGKPPAGGPATDEQKMTPDGGTATDETKTPDCCAATEGPPNGECPDASDERALDAG